ncbi:hypothetical protein [Neobacillus sp. PS3-40]|uniref:hypothetical protein n=1 Tax=Neobacillus sp. PS3-40 TaxID=3070679 RepID=UPI0027E213E7|nr:hypothetical protein [Neobacillus sp. PS3-40]WML44073.1 hypothetical protein RCG20_20205 [Neobacillus sp. PS3-40]
MGFRHDMRDKTQQQQAIVRQRDLNEELRKKDIPLEKQKQTEINNEVDEFKKYLSNEKWKQEASINTENTPPYEYSFRKIGTQERVTVTLRYRESFKIVQDLLKK